MFKIVLCYSILLFYKNLKPIIIYMKHIFTKLILAYALFLSQNSNAQVGIGTKTPNASSMLEISSTDTGILIPRIALRSSTEVAPVKVSGLIPPNSTLVYNTTNSTDLKPGYYYWLTNKWVKIVIEDDVDVRLLSRNNHVSKDAGLNANGTSLGTGSFNLSLGYYSLNNITLGSHNNAIGDYSLSLLTTGNYNVGLGRNAGTSITTGNYNTLIGSNTGTGIVGDLQFATAIGAGSIVTASNSVVLGRVSSDDKIGIGVTNPTNRLHVKAYNDDDPIKIEGLKTLNTVDYSAAVDNLLTINTAGIIKKTPAQFIDFRKIGESNHITSDAGLEGRGNVISGRNNLAIGYYSMISDGLKDKNVAVGSYTLRNLQTGSGNVAVGNESLNINILGVNNTAIGNRSGYYQTGNYNTSLGFESIYTTTGNYNTGIGAETRIDNYSYSTAIGYKAQAVGDNVIVLGQYGTIIDNDTRTYVKVGIGTSAPKNRLHISASTSQADSDDHPLRLDGLKSSTGSANYLLIDANGIVKKGAYIPSSVNVDAVNNNLELMNKLAEKDNEINALNEKQRKLEERLARLEELLSR